ncbi:MAG: rhomboid family intramembrane serine protease [Paludibacteraceae bacterium]|nr:rhomboid family intramembrane serine protease [Paludibacteraceae bacterium]
MSENFTAEIKESFKRGNIVTKLIYVNLAVFVMARLAAVALQLFNHQADFLRFIELPSTLPDIGMQPWSLFTYMFLHFDFIHILFNLLGLYWFGKLFLIFFSERHLLGTYLLGGICGAVFFVFAYYLFPFFDTYGTTYLLGASASILAIMAATAFAAPDFEITLMFLGNVRLKYLAAVWILIDLLSVTSFNAGGHFAHLGGFFFGLLFALSYKHGHDITAPVNKTIDAIVNIFKRKPKLRVKTNNTAMHMSDEEYNKSRHNEDEEIDRILGKIKERGYDSLTKQEKELLFRQKK